MLWLSVGNANAKLAPAPSGLTSFRGSPPRSPLAFNSAHE